MVLMIHAPMSMVVLVAMMVLDLVVPDGSDFLYLVSYVLQLEVHPLPGLQSFIYLGSIVDRLGGTEADRKVRIGKTRGAFNQLKNVWGSPDLPINIRVGIFNSMV